ncbi:hypothetical protein HanIR_Chr14g0692141 [Helianthus annuus]|nr:hypothetical protein HanIR_Chr14g0692141 [Helianthus annuus]
MKCLSIEQKNKLSEIGFGSFVDNNCSRVPGKLGYYVVDHFQPKSMHLTLPAGKIKVTSKLIQRIFDIPCGGTPINKLIVKNSTKKCYKEWQSQFDKDIRPNALKEKIEKSESADMNFVLNFIALFLSSMVECNQSGGGCKTDILERIDESVDIRSLDWCGFILQSLKTCKKGWKRNDSSSFFNGPIVFLLIIYLDGTSFEHMDSPREILAFNFWSIEMMKKRQTLEIQCGGFGQCEIKSSNTNSIKEDSDMKVSTFL